MTVKSSSISKVIVSFRKAIDTSNLILISNLAEANPDLINLAHPDDGQCPLLISSAQHLYKVTRLLLKLGANTEVFDPNSNATPLHWAAYEGYTDIIELLLSYGASTNSKEMVGQEPLHWAARKGKLEAISILVDNNADINALDNRGASPIFYAAEHRREDAIKLLVRLGAKIDITDCYSSTPLSCAKDSKCSYDIIKLLE